MLGATTLGSLHKLRLRFLTFYHVCTPLSLHFLCSNSSIFLTTYPPLNANVICEGSLITNTFSTLPSRSVEKLCMYFFKRAEAKKKIQFHKSQKDFDLFSTLLKGFASSALNHKAEKTFQLKRAKH